MDSSVKINRLSLQFRDDDDDDDDDDAMLGSC